MIFIRLNLHWCRCRNVQTEECSNLFLHFFSEQLLTPIESNLSISNKNVREGTLSENQSIQTGQKASSNSPYDDDIDECDQDYSSDVPFDPNLIEKAVLGKDLWIWCSINMIPIYY